VRLFDAAEVREEAPGGWERGWDGDSRMCGNVSVYLSECDPAATADVIGEAAGDPGAINDCGYRVIPFGIVAEFRRSNRSTKPDDENWLVDAMWESAEMPVARGLLVRQGMGLVTAGAGPVDVATDVWLGNADVEAIPAPALTDGNAVAAAVSDARSRFFRKTIGVRPIFHVNPGAAIWMKKAGVIEMDPNSGEARTAWGDPAVISDGYGDVPGLTASPVGFFTGPIEITLSRPKPEDVIQAVRRNITVFQATMVAAIDTPPCAMVRIGDAPAPVAP
jgi:hypothetical protein